MLRLYRQHLLARGNSLGTITQHIGDLHRLGPTFPNLLAVTAQDLEQYLARRARTWKPEYNKRIRTSLRIFYQWALREGRISVDPTIGLSPVRIPRALPRPTPDSVVLSAFDAGTLAERAMLSLAAAQGLRREEIASAHPANRVGANLRVIGKKFGRARGAPRHPHGKPRAAPGRKIHSPLGAEPASRAADSVVR